MLCFLVIMSMYGGGFATVPAYLATCSARATSARSTAGCITAWSAAGVFGPVLVNYIRQFQIDSGVPKAQAYNTHDVHHGRLLVVGFFCNLAIKAVDARFHMTRDVEEAQAAVGVAGDPAGA